MCLQKSNSPDGAKRCGDVGDAISICAAIHDSAGQSTRAGSSSSWGSTRSEPGCGEGVEWGLEKPGHQLNVLHHLHPQIPSLVNLPRLLEQRLTCPVDQEMDLTQRTRYLSSSLIAG